jgi:hypothetical protein
VLRRLLVESSWDVHARGVQLRGARIDGVLDLQSTHLRCALVLEDCLLDSPGPVVLDYAAGTLIALLRCELPGLTGDLLVLAHDLVITGSTVTGTVRLPGADITGQLICRGAHLTGTDGNALVADGMRAGGVFLGAGFTAAGTVRLSGADITGQLSCRGADLTGTDGDGNALVADGTRTGGNVLLDDRFTAAGAVRLRGVRVEGSLTLEGAQLAEPVALSAQGLQITDELWWCPRSPVRGVVDLERAGVHRLVDDWRNPNAHWPPPGQLMLDGFTYDGFGGEHEASWRQRRDWIRQRPAGADIPGARTVSTQPYEQLARVYRQRGQEAEAQEIAIAQRNELRRGGGLNWPRWISSWVLDKTIKHGYRPLRAVGLLAGLYVLVVLALWGVQHHSDVMVPAKDTTAMTPAPTALHCSSGYPCFYPAAYALDVVVPIVKVGQADSWRIDGTVPWGWAYLAGSALATGLGWALTTLAVVGYTGLVRKQ